MEFIANTPFSNNMPEGYETLYRVSFNYRIFMLILNQEDLAGLSKHSVEIVFPWRLARQTDEDVDNHIHRLVEQALEEFHTLGAAISALESQIYLAEIDRTRCLFRIATSQPQALSALICNFDCPDAFNLPRVSNDNDIPSFIVANLIR